MAYILHLCKHLGSSLIVQLPYNPLGISISTVELLDRPAWIKIQLNRGFLQYIGNCKGWDITFLGLAGVMQIRHHESDSNNRKSARTHGYHNKAKLFTVCNYFAICHPAAYVCNWRTYFRGITHGYFASQTEKWPKLNDWLVVAYLHNSR